MAATVDQISLVSSLLPDAAKDSVDSGGYGWNEEFIENLLNTRGWKPVQAVRFFWLQRVNESAEYIDLGKPLTQIHEQARAMLLYWDKIIALGGDDAIEPPGPEDPNANRVPISFGEIERPWE